MSSLTYMVLEPSWIHIEWGANVKDVWVAGLLQIGQGKLGAEIPCQFLSSILNYADEVEFIKIHIKMKNKK